MKKIAVIGGGSWATALVKMLTLKLKKIHWYIRRPEVIDYIKNYNHNPDYLSYIHLNPNQLLLSNDINAVIEAADIFIWAIPSAYLDATMQHVTNKKLHEKLHISAIKGILPQHQCTVSEYFQTYHQVPLQNFGMLSGPCHAEEVAMEKLSVLTFATNNYELEILIPELLTSRFIKVCTTNDLKGVEYAAVIKNIYAIAAGIAAGLGYGDNFLSILVSHSIKEARLFLETLVPTRRDILDTVYTGDLLVTSYSQFSRNRMFGTLIGKGYSVQYSLIEMKMVAEGYYATESIYNLSRQRNIHTPILDCIYNILYRNTPAFLEMKILAEQLY